MKSLDLSDCININDVGLSIILKSSAFEHTEELNFSNTSITDTSVMNLIKKLETNRNIKKINFYNCKLIEGHSLLKIF